jgi:hypothetical protein
MNYRVLDLVNKLKLEILKLRIKIYIFFNFFHKLKKMFQSEK